MDSLFGIPLTSILVTLLLALGVILGIIAVIGARHPLFVRMGLRNIRRRQSQTLLIVIGLMLSTLIISAAFATGDTVAFSITNQVFDDFEEADFVIGFDQDLVVERDARFLTERFLAQVATEYGGDPDFDGVAGLLVNTLPVVNPERRLSEPETSVVGVDPATIDSFRGLRTVDGKELSAATLSGRRAYISQDLAEEIDAGAGDTVNVFFEGAPTAFEVIEVVRDTSITGAGADPTVGGMVVNLDVLRELTGREGKLTFIVVSITGGVRDTIDQSSALEDRIDDFLLANPDGQAEILVTKAEIVELAELIGSFFVSFFLIFGLFAIAAGVLLIFLIFVMLAAERRSEMGMARAVGMQRLHLTETFLAEGIAYDLGSAAVGALAGLGVAFLLIQVLAAIGDEFGLAIAFHFNWQGFLIAYSLGVVLTFITVAFSAFRVANLNIVRAIRDLPEPQPLRGESRSIGGLLQAAVGVLWFVVWIALITVSVLLGIQVAALIIVLTTSDLPTAVAGAIGFVILASLAAVMVFGARIVRRGHFMATRGPSWVAWAVWFLAFMPLALVTWGLLLSRGWAARHRNAGGWAVLMLLLGVALVWMAGWGLDSAFFSWWQGKAFAYTSGVTLSVLALGMLAVYFGVAARPAFSIAGLALVWYWLLPLPFSLFADVGDSTDFDPIDGIVRLIGLPRPEGQEGNIEMFFVSGIAMTASAVLVIIFNAQMLLRPLGWLGDLLGGVAPAVKTAVAYPLAAKFRTGMTLAMFGLVVFSLVVMATLNFNFTQIFLGDDASGGFDVAVDVNRNNRIPDLRATLAERGYDDQQAIAGVGRLRAAFPQVRVEGGLFEGYRLNGVDDEFARLQQLSLDHRAIGFDSDEAVWEAIRTNPTFAVVDASRLGAGDDPFDENESDFFLGVTTEELRAAPWQPISLRLRDPASGETMRLRVIGVLEPQVTSVIFPFAGIYTNDANLDETFGGGELEDYFIVTAEATDEAATQVARDIESTLLELGVQADSIDKLIDDAAAVSRSFQFLFEGFMALGLIVGIAALGVIAFRTVVERRQQIGMLRAIGYSRRLVAISYFLESSFIAIAGTAIGLFLGVALSYNLLTSDEFTEGADISFEIPWVRLAIIVGVAYGASALMTLLPARAASRVAVAEALRYE